MKNILLREDQYKKIINLVEEADNIEIDSMITDTINAYNEHKKRIQSDLNNIMYFQYGDNDLDEIIEKATQRIENIQQYSEAMDQLYVRNESVIEQYEIENRPENITKLSDITEKINILSDDYGVISSLWDNIRNSANYMKPLLKGIKPQD